MIQNSAGSYKGDLLIVDDEPETLRMLSAILSQEGYHVRKALDGQMAIIAARARLPDIILLDIYLPKMSGYEVCETLKADLQTRMIPIIFISVLDQAEDIVKAFRLGGSDYITKPFKTEEVIARIHNHLTVQRLQIQLKEQNRRLQEQNIRLQQEIRVRQITEASLQAANQRLQELASLDSLTGVANRRYFDDYLQQEWQRSLRSQDFIALILCDLDYFKVYNDTYGHPAGDVCLKLIAQAIDHTVQRSGDLVFRYGGEEFAVILPRTNLEGAIRVAENIRQAVYQLKISNSQSPISTFITLSIGISSLIPDSCQTPSMLLERADRALYEAKRKGRNTYCVQAD